MAVRQILGVQEQESRAPAPDHPDVRLATLAAAQHGVVSRRQLAAIGLSNSAIRHRIEVHRLHRIHTSVYAVALPFVRWGRYMAAVLASGHHAVLGYRAAAALWGLRHAPSGPVDVTVPRAGGRRRHGIALHVTRSLPNSDVTTNEGIPCTTPMRTLVDLAAVSKHERELRRALERSLELNLFDGIALDAALERSKGRRGTRMLRRVLVGLPDEPRPLANELERNFLALVLAAGLPTPEVNSHIGILQVDFQWPTFKVVVETDGKATHGHAIAFHRDRDRDLYLAARGWRVVRLSWRQVADEPHRVALVLRRWLIPLR